MVVGVPIRLTDLALLPPCVLLQWGKDGRVVLRVQTLPLALEEIAEEEDGGKWRVSSLRAGSFSNGARERETDGNPTPILLLLLLGHIASFYSSGGARRKQ